MGNPWGVARKEVLPGEAAREFAERHVNEPETFAAFLLSTFDEVRRPFIESASDRCGRLAAIIRAGAQWSEATWSARHGMDHADPLDTAIIVGGLYRGSLSDKYWKWNEAPRIVEAESQEDYDARHEIHVLQTVLKHCPGDKGLARRLRDLTTPHRTASPKRPRRFYAIRRVDVDPRTDKDVEWEELIPVPRHRPRRAMDPADNKFASYVFQAVRFGKRQPSDLDVALLWIACDLEADFFGRGGRPPGKPYDRRKVWERVRPVHLELRKMGIVPKRTGRAE